MGTGCGKDCALFGFFLFFFFFFGCRVFSGVTAASLQLLLCLPVKNPESRGRDGMGGRTLGFN